MPSRKRSPEEKSTRKPETARPTTDYAALLARAQSAAPEQSKPTPAAAPERETRPQAARALDFAREFPGYPQNAEERASLPGRITELKDRYERELPSAELQAFEALAQLLPNIRLQAELSDKTQRFDSAEIKQKYRELTQYQFLLTNLAINNVDNPDFMRAFWKSAKKINGSQGGPGLVDRYRSGVISTVATYKAFEALGGTPKLSHPDNDAFDAIDVWADEQHAVQVKGEKEDTLAFYKTDEIDHPGVEIESDSDVKVFSPVTDNEVVKFRDKVGRYARRVGKPVEGYFVRIPYSMIDPDTGKPSATLLDAMRAKLAPAAIPTTETPS